MIDAREELLGINKKFLKTLKEKLGNKEFNVENLNAIEVFREKVELLKDNNPELVKV